MDDIYGDIQASTSGGNINLNLIELGNLLKLNTSGGFIKVIMPIDQGMDLNLHAFAIKTPFKNMEGLVSKSNIKAKVNGGGADVQMKTSAGSITIN